MAKRRTIISVAGIGALFIFLAGTIVYLGRNRIISVEMAMLLLVALFGLYLGFGVLIAVYLLVTRME